MVKYKLKELLSGIDRLLDSRDIEPGFRECATAEQATSLVKEMHDKGYVFRTRQEVKGWGIELFFEKNK